MTIATAPLRARCPSCRWRFDWPLGVPQGEPERPAPWVACPNCYVVRRLEPEPLDERWWRHLQQLEAV